MLKSYRDKTTIMADILTIIQKPSTKTRIKSTANLTFAQTDEYLAFLLAVGLLEKTLFEKRVVYIATNRGNLFVDKQRQLLGLLKEESIIVN